MRGSHYTDLYIVLSVGGKQLWKYFTFGVCSLEHQELMEKNLKTHQIDLISTLMFLSLAQSSVLEH